MHWIQAKKATEHLDDAEPGRIVGIDGSELVVRVDGELRRYGVEDPGRIAGLVERHGRKVLVQERWLLLRLRRHLISIRRVAR